MNVTYEFSIWIIFIICIVFIYLILCSLYESIFIPMVVILAVPFGLMGSFLFAKCFGWRTTSTCRPV